MAFLVGPESALAADPARALTWVGPPIGVIGDMARHRGDVVLAYRFHRQSFSGLMNGTTRLEGSLPGFDVKPTSLDKDHHLFEVLWAPFEQITVSAILPYVQNEMTQIIQNTGESYKTTSGGFGDLEFAILHRVFSTETSRLHLNLALSFPTGSTTESQVTRVSPGVIERLPYVMQLGSGTVDLKPGATYNGLWKRLYWGGQVGGVLRAGTNSQGYTLGDAYAVTGWVGATGSDWFAGSFRLDWNQWFNIEGQDELMNPLQSPTEDPQLQAGQRLDVLLGIDLFLGGRLKGTRISLEGGCPVYQSLEGPQLRTSWILTAGVHYAL